MHDESLDRVIYFDSVDPRSEIVDLGYSDDPQKNLTSLSSIDPQDGVSPGDFGAPVAPGDFGPPKPIAATTVGVRTDDLEPYISRPEPQMLEYDENGNVILTPDG